MSLPPRPTIAVLASFTWDRYFREVDAFWVLEEAARSRAAHCSDLEARARLERYLRLCHLELLRASQSIGDMRADTLENAAAKNHRLSATLLEASTADLHGLAWLSNTPVARACLARWEEPGEGQCWPDLTVTGYYGPSGATTVAVGSRWPIEAFPPNDFVYAALNIADPGPVTLIPVRTQSSNWGILAFVGPADSWLSRAEDLLLRLAALLPSALERDDLLQSLEHQREILVARQKRLSALQSISGSLALMRTPSEIGHLVMSSSALLLDAPLSRIRLLGEDGVWLVQVVATSEQGNDLFPARRLSTDEAPSAEAIRTRQPVWLESAAEMTARFPGFAAEMVARGYQSSAALPLLIGEQTVGTLGLLYIDQRRFSAEDREFLTAVAGMIAQALDKARLYVQEQARAQAAEDLARMRGDFVASVSHELRTPLTAIVGYAELLEVRWSAMSEDARLEHVRRIVWSANRQMRLVQDLLLISRLDLQALSLDCTPADLQALVGLAVTEVQGSYRGQQIQTTGPAGILVRADTARLVQILVNLLDNAAKYSPEGTQIEVGWESTVSQAVVRVRDHGPGIPAEGRSRLFARFGKIAASRIRAGRVGTGLGLFLGRQLARAMAGDLDLESTGPEGSTFCLRLPLVLEMPQELMSQDRTLARLCGPLQLDSAAVRLEVHAAESGMPLGSTPASSAD
jgi:signal transduction histidine kinase